MTLTPDEQRTILAGAHRAIQERDQIRQSRVRAVGATACLLLVSIAAWQLWVAKPEITQKATDSTIEPVANAHPAWLEIITTDEEIEEAFREAGECAKVVHVDHRIVTVACADLEAAGAPSDAPHQQ